MSHPSVLDFDCQIHLREAKRAAEERFRKLEQSCDQLSSEVTEYRCDSESQMNLLRREAEANQENLVCPSFEEGHHTLRTVASLQEDARE